MKIENSLIYVLKSLTLFKTSPFLEKAGHPLSTRSSLCQQFWESVLTPTVRQNSVLLLKPDLPSVSAVFCQRRSATPSAAQASDCIHQEQHKGIDTMETPFCQFILNVLDHCCIIQTHQHQGCRKHSSAAHGMDHVGGQ